MSQTKQRRWTKQIIEHLETNGFHPTDVDYGNSYFIFKYCKDMEVHFHIKELKGWRFGIWWNLDGEKTFDFFTQYERDIDKFKPSASTLVKEDVALEDWYLKDLVEMCRFIKKHPYRAWALDQSHTRDIWEWDTLDDAVKEYVKSWWEDLRFNQVHERMRKRHLKLLESITNLYLKNPKIIDNNKGGWVSSPRYTVICDNFSDGDVEGGRSYGIPLKEELLGHGLFKKINQYNKKMKKYYDRWCSMSDIELGDELIVTVRGKVSKMKNGGMKKGAKKYRAE